MNVQDYLRAIGDTDAALSALTEQHGIKVTRSGDLVCLNYDITSTRSDIADDCRALVLRVGTWDVVSFSFRRFYNHHEGRAAEIDWPTAVVREKLDGSLLVFFHDGDRWRMQTRGMIDASGEVPSRHGTFAERITQLVQREGFASLDELFDGEDRNHCIVCEYVGPHNRIVTQYDSEDLYLLTVTDRVSLVDLGPDGHDTPWPWKYPKQFNIGSIDDAINSLASLPKLDEGYVVVDGNGKRIKIKNPAYVALHHAINAGNAPTDKNFAALALQGDTDEIKGYFPELADRIAAFESVADQWAQDAEAVYADNADAGDQKTFALAVKDHPLSPWMFQHRAGKVSGRARDWMRDNLRPERFAEQAGRLVGAAQ